MKLSSSSLSFTWLAIAFLPMSISYFCPIGQCALGTNTNELSEVQRHSPANAGFMVTPSVSGLSMSSTGAMEPEKLMRKGSGAGSGSPARRDGGGDGALKVAVISTGAGGFGHS